MSLAGIIEQAERAKKTFLVPETAAKPVVDAIADHVGVHDVAIERTPRGDRPEPTAVLLDGDDAVATAAVADLHDYVTGWRRHGLAGTDLSRPALLGRLDDTYFRSYGKPRMVVASKQVEQRAWTNAAGRLHVGFQYLSKVRPQWHEYRKLADVLDVHVYGEPDWDLPTDDVVVHALDTDEVQDHWWVAYDGGGDDACKATLLAQEDEPNRFSGFWSFDAGVTDDVVGHLSRTYQ